MGAEKTRCWLCGGEVSIDPAYSSIPYFRCADCGFLFDAQREIGELHEIYGDEYFDQYPGGEAYDADPAQRSFEGKQRLKWLKKRVLGGALLEIGAADGSFLAEATIQGFDCIGVEPAPGPAARARDQRGLDVRTGFLETVELPDRRYDAVCAWHVLEHLTTPHEAVRRLRSLTADVGRLFLEIPNIESIQARAQGPGWFHLDPANHVAFYSPAQLSRLLEDCGFQLVEVDTISAFSHLRPGRALRPRELAARALTSARERALAGRPHAWKHELLRAVAKPV